MTASVATNGTNGSHIPEVCRAAVCLNSGPNYTLELREDFPVPKPGPGELLVKLNATGICLSDHHYMEGKSSWSPRNIIEEISTHSFQR